MELTEEEKQRVANGEDIWTFLADRIGVKNAMLQKQAADMAASTGEDIQAPMSVYDEAMKRKNDELNRLKYNFVQGSEPVDNAPTEEDYKKAEELGEMLKTIDPVQYADVNPDLVNNPEEGPTMWSRIADFITGVNPFGKTGAGTSMAGWTRYNGSASPIAAAYNSWLQNKHNRMADVAKTAYNADLQKEITKLNNEKASENLATSKAAEVKAKQEIIDDGNFKADQAGYASQYNQIDNDINKAKLELGGLDKSNTADRQKLEKLIENLEANRKVVLLNMRDNADSYGRPVSKKYQDAFDTYLENTDTDDDEKTPKVDDEATEDTPKVVETPKYDVTALNTEASALEAERNGLGGLDYRQAGKITTFNKKVKAFNDKLKKLGVPSSAIKPLNTQAVPQKPKSEVDSDKEKAFIEWVMKNKNGVGNITPSNRLYNRWKEEYTKKTGIKF